MLCRWSGSPASGIPTTSINRPEGREERISTAAAGEAIDGERCDAPRRPRLYAFVVTQKRSIGGVVVPASILGTDQPYAPALETTKTTRTMSTVYIRFVCILHIHRVNYFRRSVHRVNAISQHDWLASWLLAWLADWLKPATLLQSRTNEPRDCPERNWSTGTGVVLPRSWTSRGTTWVHLDSWRDTPTHAARCS